MKLFSLALFGAMLLQGVSAKKKSCPLKGYKLVWSDEFKGKELDLDKWTYQEARAGWVNRELQTYVAGQSPQGRKVVELKDGVLHITAFQEGDKVYSGRIYGNRKEGFLYGYVEARIKLPKGRGTWPAWWMMPIKGRWPVDGEIDIMEEVGYDPDVIVSSIHCAAYNHPAKTQKTNRMKCEGAEGEFHVYALEWTEDYIKTFVDGKELFYFANDGKGDHKTWPFHTPFYPILNVAWGGNWGGSKGIDESALPVTMEVDYVRIWQKK